jgi:hypothetical protein
MKDTKETLMPLMALVLCLGLAPIVRAQASGGTSRAARAQSRAQTSGKTAEAIRSSGAALDRTRSAGSITTLAQNPPAAEAPVEAQAVPRLPEGTPVVVVGEIKSPPKPIIGENKIQVAVGPGKIPYTLDLSGAKLYDERGAVIKPSRLDDKLWVRAEGTVMNDPQRIKVKRLQVIGKDEASLRQSPFYRPASSRAISWPSRPVGRPPRNPPPCSSRPRRW